MSLFLAYFVCNDICALSSSQAEIKLRSLTAICWYHKDRWLKQSILRVYLGIRLKRKLNANDRRTRLWNATNWWAVPPEFVKAAEHQRKSKVPEKKSEKKQEEKLEEDKEDMEDKTASPPSCSWKFTLSKSSVEGSEEVHT